MRICTSINTSSQASPSASSHHSADGNRQYDQLPHRGRRRRDRRPRPRVVVLTRRHVGDGRPRRVVHTGVGKLDVTTVTERQRCFRHCAHRAGPGRGRVRPGSKAPDSEVQPPRHRRRATTPSVEAALHTSRARVGEVPRLRRPLCVGSAAVLRAASATHLQRKREHPSPAGDHKHPTAIRRQPYLDVEESKSDFAAGRGLRQLVLDD
jgi:hypothetical protein